MCVFAKCNLIILLDLYFQKLIYEVEKSLEAPEDTIDRLQIVSNSTLDD